MTETEYKEFNKRYDKFRKNNLPTPFWDEKRQTLEYVYFYNTNSSEQSTNDLEVYDTLTDALGDIAFIGFYYSFTCKYIQSYKKDGKYIREVIVGHDHAHSFEEVVKALYASPKSFSISKDEEQYYSKQELKYLRRVQKYLLFLGIKDLETIKAPVSRYRNKLQSKYGNIPIYTQRDEVLHKIMNKEIDYRIITWYPDYRGPRTYEPHEYRALLADSEDNIKMHIEFIYEEVKLYKDIKNIIKLDNLKDDDKLILNHFKILETFDE